MLIRVRFFGDLREYTRKRWLTVEIPRGSSLVDLISELSKRVDSGIAEKLLENERLNSGFKILVNGRSITHLMGLNTILRDRDMVTIMPVAGGG